MAESCRSYPAASLSRYLELLRPQLKRQMFWRRDLFLPCLTLATLISPMHHTHLKCPPQCQLLRRRFPVLLKICTLSRQQAVMACPFLFCSYLEALLLCFLSLSFKLALFFLTIPLHSAIATLFPWRSWKERTSPLEPGDSLHSIPCLRKCWKA